MKSWSLSYTCGTLSGCMFHQSVQSLPGGHDSSCPQLTMSSVLELWEPARLWEPRLPTDSDENCVCDSPHILLCTPCSCWGNSWGLLPSAKFKQKQVPITESLAEFLSLSYLPISNYVSFAWNLRFCCVPHFCSWVSEMVQIWEVTVSECQGHRLVACTVGEGSLRN